LQRALEVGEHEEEQELKKSVDRKKQAARERRANLWGICLRQVTTPEIADAVGNKRQKKNRQM